MIDFESIKDSLSAFSLSDFARKKPLIFALMCLLILLFILALVILLIQTSPEKKVKVPLQERFEADAPVLYPDSVDIEKDYYFSRTSENQWEKEEVDKWFTYPDDESMKELADSNDKVIKDILGAAP